MLAGGKYLSGSNPVTTSGVSLMQSKHLLLSVMACLVIATCQTTVVQSQEDDIDATYGQGNQSAGRYSINGTGVLAQMFEDRGHSVFYSRVLGRPTRQADVIIWAPDNFHVPSESEVAAIEKWLQEKSNRTFIVAS